MTTKSYEERLLAYAEDGDWWEMPAEEPSNSREIIKIATREDWSDSLISLAELPKWLSRAIIRDAENQAEEQAHYAYRNRSRSDYDYPDFDYAYDTGRYAEDSWAAYGDYLLDH